jgi:outer membrane protein assembly factor BamB
MWITQLALSCICPECGCGSLSTPAFDGNMLYVGAGVDPDGDDLGSLYAIVPDTGEIVWKRVLTGTVIAPTTVANGVVYAASTTGVAAFDAQTGETVWEDGTQSVSYAQPVIVDGTLYTTYLPGYVVAWKLPPPAGNALDTRRVTPKPVPARKP